MSNSVIIPKSFKGFTGYSSDASNAGVDRLCPPCINMIIDETGVSRMRLGYIEEFELNVSNRASTSFYMEQYDIAFFAIGTKVYYRDFQAQETIDTGITLTDNTTTRFAEYLGNLYLTNTTDGIQRIIVGRLNGNVTAGASEIIVDIDMGSRISVFSATGSLRISGVDEAFTSVTVGTGAVALTGTSSQAYVDNQIAIVVSDISSGREKPSKILFWKERMHLMGFPSASNVDLPNHTVVSGQFVIGTTAASAVELIENFTYGTGGSTKIPVGKSGRVTNIVGAKDYIYFFKEGQSYSTNSADITTSGSGIGGTIPELRDENFGCLNEDSASVVGNNEIMYITNDKRILIIRIATASGAPVQFPDETFDRVLWKDLRQMDDEQTGALNFHHRGARRTINQIKIGGQFFWYIYDHTIGDWLPPQQVVPVKSFFERKGVLYGTDYSNGKVYSFNTAFSDNGVGINAIWATAEIDTGDAMVKRASIEGDITYPTEIICKSHVTNNTGGMQSSSDKVVDGSNYTYSASNSISTDQIGSGGIGGGESQEIASWKKEWDVYPQEAQKVQLTASSDSDGGNFSVEKYTIQIETYDSFFERA